MSINFDKDVRLHALDDNGHAQVVYGPLKADATAPATDHEREIKDQRGITRAAGVVGAATLLSRLLGALRDIVIASFFGAGLVSDAFIAAFRIPNLLRRMFGEGSLSIAFVPVYSDALYHEGRAEADRLAGSAMRLLTLVLLAAVVLGMWAAPWLTRLLAPGFGEIADKMSLTVTLTRMMFPYIFFIGMMALCMGILNVLGHFAAPALAPVCLNMAMITSLLAGACFVTSKEGLVKWLAAGVVAGGVLQLALQVPFLIKNKVYFWHPARLWHPALKRSLVLLGPVLLGAAVYQINSLVITLLGSFLPQGSISYLYYADRLVQFPLGVFGIATATAVLPTLARQSSEGQFGAMRLTFAHAIKLLFFMTLPAMAGLIVLREPIVSLLFQRGAFDEHSMQLTAGALLYYGMGLWAFSAVRIVLNVFYALKDTHTPVRIAVWSIAANIVFSVVLMVPMQQNGLALALSMSSTVNLALLTVALRKKLGALGWRGIAYSLIKSGACAAVMGAGVWMLSHWLLSATAKGIALLPGLIGCIVAGAIIFGFLASVLKIPELGIFIQLIHKKRNCESDQ